MPSDDESTSKDDFASIDEARIEIEYWRIRALEAERLRNLDREYIEDLYHLRDIDNGWVR
jgi:hypothetical protein